ncbi:AmmeMemoRadiSam system protein A [Aestuariirhabdus sp. LZHN29]|uniref:AmmeMemoRadiSam system protein A n=1 Tax=Aestuariirhabdus sp. LZHN29 TaxID=3417462 RepID=UPI003CE99038
MPPMPCTDIELPADEQHRLLLLARQAIAERWLDGGDCKDKPSTEPALLQRPAAAFVTLTQNGRLRGCMGTMDAQRALAQEVIEDARSAAFRDLRFPPLTEAELDTIRIEISILSPMQPIAAANREQLLKALRPGVDGVLIESGNQHATFLPQVWEQLPDGDDFLDHLLRKAGLDTQRWADDMTAYCYQVQHFSEPV